MVQDQPTANNPMYTPQFQDYVVDRTDASFHANPTYGPILDPDMSAAERALKEDTTGDGVAHSGLLSWPSELRLGSLRRMSAALATAMGGIAAGRRSSGMPAETANGNLDAIHKPPSVAESTLAAASSHISGRSLQAFSADVRGNSVSDSLSDRTPGKVDTGSLQEGISESEGREYAFGTTESAGVLPGSWGATKPTNDEQKGDGEAADIEIAIRESSASEYGTDSIHDSSDLTFTVTDGFDLEELPRTSSHLPKTVSQLPKTASELPPQWQWHAGQDRSATTLLHDFSQSVPKTSPAAAAADHLTGSSAAVTMGSNKEAHGQPDFLLSSSMESTAAFLVAGVKKSRSPDYELFAQLSAATSASEGTAPRPAPFALGYESPHISAAAVSFNLFPTLCHTYVPVILSFDTMCKSSRCHEAVTNKEEIDFLNNIWSATFYFQ